VRHPLAVYGGGPGFLLAPNRGVDRLHHVDCLSSLSVPVERVWSLPLLLIDEHNKY